MLYNFLPNALQYFLASYLFSSTQHAPPSARPLQFNLRHEYGLTNSSRTVFADVHPSSPGFASQALTIGTTKVKTHKLQSRENFATIYGRRTHSGAAVWDEEEVVGPDVGDKDTLIALAKMTNNDYFKGPEEKGWYDVGGEWNSSYPHGWEPDADGLRGHIFATADNSTVVISVKGTSAGWMVGGGGPTTKKDKLNDNLFFSCCCARVGPTWWTVCDCFEGNYKCDQGCLEKSLTEDSLFYSVGANLYNNVSYMYPDSNIWIVGHSLGGSLSSLIGLSFGIPVVAFEAPGDRLAAKRLHLPLPPSLQHITHVYHTGDPIPQGACTGVSSICAIGGFALETKCHMGKVMRFDTVTKLGWSVDTRTHSIVPVIEEILTKDHDWSDDQDKADGRVEKRSLPRLIDEEDCILGVWGFPERIPSSPWIMWFLIKTPVKRRWLNG